MSSNSIGKNFTFTTWGESHGKAIGCVIDGVPSRINLEENDIQTFLNSQLKIENNKFCCEIITNFVFIIISNSYDLLKVEKYNEIFENIKYVNSMKNGDLVGLNNKIIFKHRDIFEKYKPH